jgi:hypothetical protein
MEAAGKLTVPPLTVSPLENVGTALQVSVLALFVPIVAFPVTLRVASLSVPVTLMFENVCVADHVLAVASEPLAASSVVRAAVVV